MTERNMAWIDFEVGKGIPCMEFGKGEIGVGQMAFDDFCGLVFSYTGRGSPVGTLGEGPHAPHLLMNFANVASVDVLLTKLREVRAILADRESEKEDNANGHG